MNRTQTQPSAMAEAMMRFLDCSCTCYGPLEEDSILLDAYWQAREEGQQKGFTPMLLVVNSILLETICTSSDESCEGWEDFHLEHVRAFRQRMCDRGLQEGSVFLKEMHEAIQDISMKEMFASDEEMDMEAANDVTNTSFTAYWDYGASQTSEVIMARIPTANPWAESLKKASV